MSSNSMSSSSNRYRRKKLALANGGRTRFSPPPSRSNGGSSSSTNNNVSGPSPASLHHLLKLNQLVDTLKSLKRLISHYFDQTSKQAESILAGDVRRVYRRILLLYVKYRRRQNYEKRRMKQPIDESDDDDNNNNEMETIGESPTWTMKKIVTAQCLPFTRAGFDADHDGVEDFDEIALAATRDVANVQNHCVRLIMDDHPMRLPIYGLQTRWDSELPKQRKQPVAPPSPPASSATGTRVEFVKKTGIKTPHVLPPPAVLTPPSSTDQELFLDSLARSLSDQTWQQLQSIMNSLNPPNIEQQHVD